MSTNNKRSSMRIRIRTPLFIVFRGHYSAFRNMIITRAPAVYTTVRTQGSRNKFSLTALQHALHLRHPTFYEYLYFHFYYNLFALYCFAILII